MSEDNLQGIYLRETAFDKLMQRRIFNVLLIASRYDAFMLEEDGRVEEQLYFEYVRQNLSSPPRVTRVSNMRDALEELDRKPYDLVIAMPNADISETIEGSREIKEQFPGIPIVLLTPFSRGISERLADEDLSSVDYVFSWLGNMELLVAVIKLLEDKMNEADINEEGVQVIILVEDSVRFYSSVLPTIYKYLFGQSLNFATEALNEHEKMLRMRGRPKVMLARTYEEAMELYDRFSDRVMGIITDVAFEKEGVKDSEAGLKLAVKVKEKDPTLPVIVESSESRNASKAAEVGCVFIDKNSKKLPVDLGDAISDKFGFGDFIVRDPADGKEIMRLRNLKDMQRRIFDIPADALMAHAKNNDFSRWFYSRALFALGDIIKLQKTQKSEDVDAARKLYFNLIVKYRRMKNRGVIAEFQRDRFDNYSNFARIGQGSLGGKGRGLAFIDSIIKKNPVCDNFYGVSISIPRTVVLCTDIFDEFMRSNRLYPIALSNASDEEILAAFLNADLPEHIIEDLLALFDVVDKPLAIRSSSLLEDSHYQPFAGVYATYMVDLGQNCMDRLKMVSQAIKGVYASVFYHAGKAYMNATSNVIDQEKMAVIIQEVVGEVHGDYYFPSFSGVGRSLNYYPIGNATVEEGVAEVAVGLGKHIVDGGKSLRFTPLHPENALQTSTLDTCLRDTQTILSALPLKSEEFDLNPDDGFNIKELSVQDFANTGSLQLTASTYDAVNGILRDTDSGRGRRVITFANILRDKALPLAPAIDFMLRQGQNAMQRPVEIEFAGNIDTTPGAQLKGQIYWLQIRPIIDRKEFVGDEIIDRNPEELLLNSSKVLGNGRIDDVKTVVYVRPDKFDSLQSPDLARKISELNAKLKAKGKGYALIGPGRWGSSDPALGIPVAWADISGAKLIAEASTPDFKVEPSQGTHFFHNLTSFGVAYFTVNPGQDGDIYDLATLESMPASYDDGVIRVVEFPAPLEIAVNGRTGVGNIAKPQFP